MTLDVEFARRHFPALATDWALMDNAGGSVPLGAVIERVCDYMSTRMVQLGASYPHSVEAREAVAAGRAAVAELVNAAPDEIVIGTNTNANIRTLARALRPLWEDGDEIVVTNLDHESNIAPWRQLEASGIRVREWCFDPDTMRLRTEDLEPLLNDRTRLVAYTHCANIVGTVHDAQRINRLVHAAGALSCVDGVAFAPHRRVDVAELGADFYFVSLYKTFGPHIGLMFGRREHLARAQSQNYFFIGPDAGPYRFEPGNPNHELTASLVAIPEYLRELSRTSGGDGSLDSAFALITEHETRISQPLLEFLAAAPGVRLLGEPVAGAMRVPTIAFTVEGSDAATIPPLVEEHQVAVRYGHFHAYRAVRELGLLEQNGVVRISLAHYNTAGEVDRLLESLDKVLDAAGRRA
jgi:cysteine desulfurase family protein (TIGR01976 family)